MADIEKRKFWTKYRDAFEKCLSETSTDTSPWYVVPADDKEGARLVVSQIVLDTLGGQELRYPKTITDRRNELLEIHNQLAKPEEPPSNP